MISVDQIIEAYKRGLEDGRKGGASQQGVPYGDWQQQRQRWPGDSTGNPPIDTRKITCEYRQAETMKPFAVAEYEDDEDRFWMENTEPLTAEDVGELLLGMDTRQREYGGRR